MSTVEFGFVFSGNVGTGILIKKNSDGSWSPPCAMGLTGVGWGFIAGGQVKETITFFFDEGSLNTALGDVGIKLSSQGAATIANMGRNYDAGIGISNKGMSSSLTMAFSKGIFAGLSIEGAAMGPRSGVNDSFYNTANTTPLSIVDGSVTFPTTKETLINEVYDKLSKLAEGVTATPTPDEAAKVASLSASAQAASDAINQSSSDVVQVNAAEEAAKEG
jgi:SH3 domain-containing YSC84-like protein 1